MKGFKKKIMAMALGVMMVVSMFGNVVSAGGVNTLQMDSLKYGTQKVTVPVGGISFFSYTPTKTGKQGFTVKVPEGYVTSAAIFLDEQSDMPTTYGPEASESSINFSFKAGTLYLLAFYVYPKNYMTTSGLGADEESEVEATITLGEPINPIYVEVESSANYSDINVEADNVKGLSWDPSTNTLTMDGYTAENSTIYINNSESIYLPMMMGASPTDVLEGPKSKNAFNMSGYSDGGVSLNEEDDRGYKETYYDVTLYVKGVNNLKDVCIYVDCGINLTVKGDGELNFSNDQDNIFYFSYIAAYYDAEQESSVFGINNRGKLTIDGPQINASGKYIYDIMDVPNFEMKSGTMYLEVSPKIYNEDEVAYAEYSSIYVEFTTKITGGNIVVKYEGIPEGTELNSYKEEDGSLYYYRPIINSGDILIENATVIVTGDKDVAEKLGTPYINGYGKDGKLNIADSATYLIGNPIDISKLKVELSETSYNYDGTAKTPSVKVAGLKEGIDFEVAYKNNVEIGTATVTVKGKGCFEGSVDATFEIKGAVADGPKEGTTIKDKKYIYKVTKAGSKDGSIVGELKVTGLKKKSLTQIKIAAKVKIGGVTYKVTSVGAKAFKGNKKITKVFVGKNVKSIGANAFAKCTKLKQASINSKALTSIGKNAFNGDKKLKKIIVKSTKLKKVGKKALAGTSKKLVVKVPKAKKKAYTKLFKKAGNKKVKVK